MRNLQLVNHETTNWIGEDLQKFHLLSIDEDTSDVYIAAENSLFAVTLNGLQRATSQINLSNEGIQGQPICLQYLCDQQAVCVATQDGVICLWEKGRDQIECVGDVPQGLTSMSWSPDFELFVLTTANNTLILMTREFDAITELPLFSDHEREESPVSVGWGKKETQFHGSAGKEAAKKTAEALQPVSENDPGTVSVKWRGDGQYFVVNAIDPATGTRSLYVWSRECIFQSKSEPVNGLQYSLDWKPSGALIASVQTRGSSNQQDVIFYEKNGLRHGQFSVHLDQGKDILVHRLAWNQDSTVLCLWLVDKSNDTSEVQLMTVNNYHWYLKQSLKYSHHLNVVEWDPEHPYKLYVGSQSGMNVYTWAWTTCCTFGREKNDVASVAVIDGAKLLVTPMRQMVVPPPMAAFTLTLPSPANFVTFNPFPSSNDLATLMADGRIALYKYQDNTDKKGVSLDAAGGDGFKPMCDVPSLTNVLAFTEDNSCYRPLQKHHLLWADETKFVYVTSDETESCSKVHIGDMNLCDNTVSERCCLGVKDFIIGVALAESRTHVIIQLNSGTLLKLDIHSETIQPWESNCGEVSFPYPCTSMAVSEIGGEEVVLGLTDKFRFYVNDTEVASNCTSFAVHNGFLLLTTLTHTIRFIHRSTKVSELPKLSEDKDHPFDESIRRVERGSRIVTIVSDDTKLILQMPRGNLETFHPRALILSTLQKLLDSGHILDAFLMMRKHRVNLNLIYDHNPDKFIKNVDEYIHQIDSITHLNLFITELVEEDITKTMYTASYQHSIGDSKSSNKSTPKIDVICDVLLSAFQRLGQNKFLLPILTAHVKKTTPEFEQALQLVWSLQDNKSDAGSCSALDALKYLLFLVDVNTMYNVALGTYNFDLVMMVAQQSQKDPKEYISFLNELRHLEENYRCFTIDKHLKKFSSALNHISKCGEDHFEESVSFVCEHKLYSKALQLYRANPKHFQHFAALYGEYLKSKNRNDEAGVMYVKAKEWSCAMDCFRADHDWRQVFCMADRLKYTPNQQSELARNVAEELKQRNRFTDAAIVYENYAKNPEEAIVSLIEGGQWTEALRLMHHYNHLDLIETHLSDALKENFDEHLELLNSQKKDFIHHKTRLEVVRTEKDKAQKLLLEGISEYNDAEADLFSDTTSVTGASVSSRQTYDSSRSTVFSKTSKASKMRQKGGKKWSLKEGSANEEFALIEALAKIMKRIDGFKEEINHLLKALMQFNEDDKAFELQEFYSDFLNLIQDSIPEIWNNSSNANNNNNVGPNTTANSIAMAMQRQKLDGGAGSQNNLDPVLCIPPTLSKDVRWKLHMAGDLKL